ncbi:hypothetical protein BC936DRAFT_142860 [Jimgerdemannia flammicorona]|uniref:Nuclease associated modular domain-containing protein n=1 Tax=Jimgerdemannia flammicorona TaxID=994334 RepID=A0A433A015_9FUNG|nr:hypothetical protein BC936DRAFT_142860 [Jimgerdemannia flammicorona]
MVPPPTQWLGFAEETKANLSAATSGSNNPNYGKTASEDTRALMSAAKVGKYAGKNNPNYGKPSANLLVFLYEIWRAT